ncbi:MAG: PD-(D/E)XK nuclease family protein [Acidobacteriia bacterium]|nr:PD-(D/E)XK nuclease family protein [Terriglobia bacterium]
MIPTARIDGTLGAQASPGDVLSPSQVSSLMECAYRWHAKYVLKMPETPTSHQVLGRAVHSALAANCEQKCDTKVDLPTVGVVAVYRGAWATLSEGMEFRDDEDPYELGKTGELLVAKYMEEAAPRIEPAAVEVRVEGVISGVKVTGYIDLLDVHGCVVDIKTAKARPSSISPMHRFQVATYWHLTPRARGTGRVDTLVKTKTPQLIQQPFSISEQELRAIETLYPKAQELMRGSVHFPNRQSMFCSRRHCGFWRHCEQKWGGEVPET